VVLGDQRADARTGLRPFTRQRFDDDRIDELHDRPRVGVVGTERRADFRIQATFEERAENRRLDGAPVHLARSA
jgi:hypothetical protein